MWAQLSAFSQVLFILVGPHLPPVAPVCSMPAKEFLSLHTPKRLSIRHRAHCYTSKFLFLDRDVHCRSTCQHRNVILGTKLSGRVTFWWASKLLLHCSQWQASMIRFLFPLVNSHFLIFHLVTPNSEFACSFGTT